MEDTQGGEVFLREKWSANYCIVKLILIVVKGKLVSLDHSMNFNRIQDDSIHRYFQP